MGAWSTCFGVATETWADDGPTQLDDFPYSTSGQRCRFLHSPTPTILARYRQAAGTEGSVLGAKGYILAVLQDIGSVVADVSIVHSTATKYVHAAAQMATPRDAERRAKYMKMWSRQQLTLCSCHQTVMCSQFLQTFASVAVSSAAGALELTVPALQAGALKKLVEVGMRE
jgi:hypothetical protein